MNNKIEQIVDLTVEGSDINEKNHHRNLGLIATIIILFGNIVGVGIFFKNISIFSANQNNPYGILLTWVIAMVITISIAVSLTEIISAKKRGENSGIAGWSEEFVGKRFGRFMHTFIPICYFSFTSVVVAFFLSEAIFNVFLAIIPSFSANNVHVGFVCILAIVLYASNVILSIFKHKFCVSVAKCLAYIKFIPIITIFLVGVIFAIVNGNIGLFNSSNNGGINFNGMISSITPALFAFDGFLFVAAISSSIKKPEKTIPKSLLISIIIIGSCYIAITFSLLLIGDGNMTNFFEKVCGDNQVLKNVISCIFAFVIVIALVATVNGFIMGAIFALQCSREENFLAFGANCHVVNNNEEYSKKKHNLIYMLFFLVFWSLIIFVPSTILNTDQIIDGTSNIIIEFEFFMITIVIVASVINRWTKKVNVKKFKYQIVIGILASIFCFSFATFSTLNDYIIAPIISPNDISSWGLFFSHDKPINILYQSIIFWAFALFFFFIPFINDLLIKISNKNYTEKLLWQK